MCPLLFINFLFLTKWQTFKNKEKCFLFHLKSSFPSRDIQIFVFPSSPLFLPVSHCFRGWSNINLIVCDIINCLYKNLIIHFVWYLGKEKRYDTETLLIHRVLNKKTFLWKNHEENMHQKLVSDPLLILVNIPKQPLHTRNFFKSKKKYFERGLSKTLKKVNIFFLPKPVPFNGQSYQRQMGPGTSAQSLFRLWNKFRKILY